MGWLGSVTIRPEGLACQKKHEDDVTEDYFYQKNIDNLHLPSKGSKLFQLKYVPISKCFSVFSFYRDFKAKI